ncbi:hypothetical protein NP493_88g03001 [Ridgeia piscesae]|uniref:Uncharacterized protein n=1 Tax=Ridgeia piscesae TaxID=27915 RepID=A0AAD9UHW8_RIDPI|nr:hypothetical protein NP493_88g03001 [Ridgeia piscesae]
MTVCLNSVTSAVFHPAAFPQRGHDTRNSIELIVAVGWRLTGAGCPTSKRRSSIVDAKILRARRDGLRDGRRGQIPPSSRAYGERRAKTSKINTTFLLQLQKQPINRRWSFCGLGWQEGVPLTRLDGLCRFVVPGNCLATGWRWNYSCLHPGS